MKKSKRFIMGLVLAVFVFSFIAPRAVSVQAAVAVMEVDEDEYNVYVGEYPSSVGTVYAKFNTKRNNVESYELSLFDDYDSIEKMEAALAKSGDKADNYEMIAMDLILYQEDSEGEFYPVPGPIEMTVICEVPSEFEDLESKVKVFAINSTGKVDNISYTLVDVDGYICMRFNVKNFTQYAFAVSNKDIEAHENSLYEDEVDEDDEDYEEEEATATPVPTKKPTAVPTKSAQTQVNDEGNKTSTSSGSSAKDNVPKTGDDFSMEKTGISILVVGSLLVSAICYIKKK